MDGWGGFEEEERVLLQGSHRSRWQRRRLVLVLVLVRQTGHGSQRLVDHGIAIGAEAGIAEGARSEEDVIVGPARRFRTAAAAEATLLQRSQLIGWRRGVAGVGTLQFFENFRRLAVEALLVVAAVVAEHQLAVEATVRAR